MKYLSAKLTLLAALVLTLSACSNSFSIKGRIDGLGDQNLRITYAGGQRVSDQMTQSKENYFEVEGQSESMTLVTVSDATGRQIARFVLSNGDEVQVRGNTGNLQRLECKGTDVNERWMQFITDNASIYQANVSAEINTKIEQYCQKHPDDVLSTVLLLFDYSQASPAQVQQLLDKLKPEAKPDDLIAVWETAQKATEAKRASRLTSMIMLASTGDFEAFKPTVARASLLWMWTPGIDHVAQAAKLKQLSEELPKLQVADVMVEPDSNAWRPTLKSDNTPWQHFWEPEGPASPALKQVGLTTTPLFVVTDSAGKVLYGGGDIDKASEAARKAMK